MDGIKNGDETDVDCGGGSCPPCVVLPLPLGEDCTDGVECESLSCVDGVCCESACDERCRACSSGKTGVADGICASVIAHTDPDDDCLGASNCVAELQCGAVAVDGGRDHHCALIGDGIVRCWGEGSLVGQAGAADASLPVTVDGIDNAIDISARKHTTCAALADGTVRCWGILPISGAAAITPVAIVGISDAVSVAVGDEHGCAALATGKVRCWGANSHGQLGDDTTDPSDVAVEVVGVNGAVEVAAAGNGSFARAGAGVVQWSPLASVEGFTGATSLSGYGPGALLGVMPNGTMVGSGSVSAPLPALSSVTAVSGGLDFACAVRVDETVRCWGKNLSGALGNGTNDYGAPPVLVVGLDDAIAVGTGGWAHHSGNNTAQGHSCAVRSNGTVTCWGGNNAGQLGVGVGDDTNVPGQVAGLW